MQTEGATLTVTALIEQVTSVFSCGRQGPAFNQGSAHSLSTAITASGAPSVGSDGKGTFLFVWPEGDASAQTLMCSTQSGGYTAGFATPQPCLAGPHTFESTLAFAIGATGVVATFTMDGHLYTSLWNPSTTTLGTPARVEAADTAPSSFAIADDGAGHATVVYTVGDHAFASTFASTLAH